MTAINPSASAVSTAIAQTAVPSSANSSASGISFGSLINCAPKANNTTLLGLLSKIKAVNTLSATTTSVSFGANLNAEQVTYTGAYSANDPSENMSSGAVESDFSRPVTVYDSSGNAHLLSMDFLKTGTNQWAVELHSVHGDVNAPNGEIASGTITFNSNGSLASVSPSLTKPENIQWTNNTKPSAISFNWGTPNQSNGLTQYDAPYKADFTTQNGAPTGQLSSATLEKNGTVLLGYTNGLSQTVSIAQLIRDGLTQAELSQFFG